MGMSTSGGPKSGKQSVHLALTVLEIVAPVFLLASIGFVWIKSGHEYRLQFVTRLVMTLSVPALVFVALVKTEIEPVALTALFGASIVAYFAITLVVVAFVKLRGLDPRTFINPLVFGNTGNIGLPLALFAFGDVGLSYAVIVFAVMSLGSFTFGVYVTAGGGNPGTVLKEPMVAASILGTIFLWQGWTLPRFAMNTLELLGQMTIPLMLITLGVAVARLPTSGIKRSAWLAAGKAILCAGIAIAVGRAFGLTDVPFAVLVIQVSTPVAVTSYMLAEKYGAKSEDVAGLVVTSTTLSVLYLPLLLAYVI